ncbi:hypothetical protein ONT16_14460 [Prevotella copri]|uniref:Uncharacterized protein n=1 Tax=Segatella copri TaxID=165179 RepID=A0AAP3BE75_9BACT|nr:hypothetical protein [Segatella copri]MCW4129419.1 hypothetical protein [Segatella copri]MCW4416441.1 hypothetical protein [Segatella copri]MCW4422956.1 hypothetical protein [Segatella copri]
MATKYNDIVTLRSMKPAYNIKYEGPDDWKSFIANDQFNDLLRKTISAVRNNDADNHKPIWIAGTYGSGKSHAGAVLKHLLCDSIDKITEYVDEEYHDSKYDLLRNSLMNLRHDTRLFPVNLYGQQDIAHEADLSLQLQKEVKNALKKEGISITVQTDFDNYIQHIENEPAFWEMLIQNNDELRSVAPSTDKLKSRLRSCDTEVLDRMRMALRNGGYSIPLQTANLQNWLFEVQGELRKQGTYTSNPQPIGFSGILLAKRQNSFYCTYFLHNRNVADTKSPYPIKRLEVIRWFNQKSMVFNQSLS